MADGRPWTWVANSSAGPRGAALGRTGPNDPCVPKLLASFRCRRRWLVAPAQERSEHRARRHLGGVRRVDDAPADEAVWAHGGGSGRREALGAEEAPIGIEDGISTDQVAGKRQALLPGCRAAESE